MVCVLLTRRGLEVEAVEGHRDDQAQGSSPAGDRYPEDTRYAW